MRLRPISGGTAHPGTIPRLKRCSFLDGSQKVALWEASLLVNAAHVSWSRRTGHLAVSSPLRLIGIRPPAPPRRASSVFRPVGADSSTLRDKGGPASAKGLFRDNFRVADQNLLSSQPVTVARYQAEPQWANYQRVFREAAAPERPPSVREHAGNGSGNCRARSETTCEGKIESFRPEFPSNPQEAFHRAAGRSSISTPSREWGSFQSGPRGYPESARQRLKAPGLKIIGKM